MKYVFWFLVTLNVVNAHGNDGRVRHSVHLDCFDVYIPLINRIANESKETSDACVATAEAKKDNEIVAVNRTRSDVFSEVKRMKETLTTCSAEEDHLRYFECLNRIVEYDIKIVGDISSKSSKYSNKIKEIEQLQIKCFRDSVSKIRDKSSRALYSLEYCLTSGNSAVRAVESSFHIQTTPLPYNTNYNIVDNNYNSGRSFN